MPLTTKATFGLTVGLMMYPALFTMAQAHALIFNEDIQADSNTTAVSPESKQDSQVFSYVGVRHVGDDLSPLSADFESFGGWIVYAIGSSEPLRYGINIAEKGSEIYIFFEDIVGRSGNTPVWEVLDVATTSSSNIAPSDPKGEYYFHYGCSINGSSIDPEIVAVIGNQDTEFITDIRQAWRANRQTRQLEALSTEGMACTNPAWGL
ncbi:MAG: hypothetical protein AAFY72_03040 [Cyanobacteria bacterium J06649_4]